jgi:Na+-translocating ferredoxin:NAD+ oxidoreductase subunit G
MTAPADAQETRSEVPSWRLLATLGGAGAIVGLCIVLIYEWTLPRIEAHKAGVLRAAIAEVLHAPERCDTLYLQGTALTITRPAGDAAKTAERVFLGYGTGGRPIGYAITTSRTGFAEPIVLILGYDAGAHRMLGMKILSSKETPGIADKIEKPVFTAQFAGAVAPLNGVKGKKGSGAGEIVMITGATISSRAVIRAINEAITRWQPLLDAYNTAQRGIH